VLILAETYKKEILDWIPAILTRFLSDNENKKELFQLDFQEISDSIPGIIKSKSQGSTWGTMASFFSSAPEPNIAFLQKFVLTQCFASYLDQAVEQ
jgi:hypothetical protein